MKKIFFIVLLFSCAKSFSQTSSIPLRKTDWTVSEVKEWAEEQKKYPTWYGTLLYQGSDSIAHHFISRVMDEWIWFSIKKTELKMPDERPYSKSSSAPIGFYYVDATNGFVKTKDVK